MDHLFPSKEGPQKGYWQEALCKGFLLQQESLQMVVGRPGTAGGQKCSLVEGSTEEQRRAEVTVEGSTGVVLAYTSITIETTQVYAPIE